MTTAISYRSQFIESAKSMASSLSNLVNNPAEGINRVKCKYGHHNKKCENGRIKYKNCTCFLEYNNFKDNLRKHICLCCNKNYQSIFDENLKKQLLIHTDFLTMILVNVFCC